MKPALSLHRRPKPEEEAADQHQAEQMDEQLPPIADGTHQTTTAIAAKAATAGLMTCLVLGPVGAIAGSLALAQTATHPAPVRAAPVTGRPAGDQAIAGEFAQRVVLTWLATTRDDPAPLAALVKDAQTTAMSQKAFTATNPAVARITRADGIWSVTVAVTVTDARRQTVRRFFQLPVHVTDGAVTALTLPTPIAPPRVVLTSPAGYRTEIGTSTPIGQTVEQFLSAYIAGASDVSRYLTPGVTLAALTPPPYTSVHLNDLRATGQADPTGTPTDGQTMRILASATASVTETQSAAVAYALTLTARAGRWEITAIDPAPVTSAAPPAATRNPRTSTPAATMPPKTTR